MKSFFEDPNAIALLFGGAFVLIFCSLVAANNYISDQQKFDAYQKALLTITQCRSATTGDVDKLCGTVPSLSDFGIQKQ